MLRIKSLVPRSAMKLPWAKVVVGCNGKLNMVRYKVSNNIDGRKILLVLKFDSFQKHTRM
jgi:hypothetical protein